MSSRKCRAGKTLPALPRRFYHPRLRDYPRGGIYLDSAETAGSLFRVERLGPAFYKRYALSHDVPLILGIGAGFLAQRTPAALAERVRCYGQAGASGGRFALYLCNIGATTPPANLTAAVEAAHGIHPG